MYVAEALLQRLIPAVWSATETEKLSPSEDEDGIDWPLGMPVLPAALGDARNPLDFEIRELLAKRAEDEDCAWKRFSYLAHALEIPFLKLAVAPALLHLPGEFVELVLDVLVTAGNFRCQDTIFQSCCHSLRPRHLGQTRLGRLQGLSPEPRRSSDR